MIGNSSAAAPQLRRCERLLIANRGEIACRIIRTARRLGITTIAVFSDVDAKAMHVTMADEAYRIGASEARASYLDSTAILNVARLAKADAIHPGYGFLSENAEFAEACLNAGVMFIGPPPSAIRAMGEKATAKSLMEKTGIPLVPGYHGEEQSLEGLAQKAHAIGFPILIKASAGGGGKGMKVAQSPDSFASQLASAKREAMSAFGDDRVLLERYLRKPRHVEVQVFADSHGNCIYLFDRDCSVQRRHQKVMEEAPAPGIPDDIRRRMGQAATDAARAIGYVGAGTVEFLYDEGQGEFYFMEMNTRLQVEHPVTEAITGLDLVEWQLSVACGGELPLRQGELSLNGHAIEVRVYAEDPAQDFLPQSGHLTRVVLPHGQTGIRVDSGVASGDTVSVHYDPMLAKIIAHGHDRSSVLSLLQRALSSTYFGGLITNIDFLERIVCNEEFRSGAPDTGFIARNLEQLLPDHVEPDNALVFFAVAGLIYDREGKVKKRRASASAPFNPWQVGRGWRLNEQAMEKIRLRAAAAHFDITVKYEPDGMALSLPNGSIKNVSGSLDGDQLIVTSENNIGKASWFIEGDHITVLSAGKRCRFYLADDRDDAEGDAHISEGRVLSPMPGRVSAVLVQAGDIVEAGQALIVVEAMKMEHSLRAPSRAQIAEIRCRVGDQVDERFELVVLASMKARV